MSRNYLCFHIANSMSWIFAAKQALHLYAFQILKKLTLNVKSKEKKKSHFPFCLGAIVEKSYFKNSFIFIKNNKIISCNWGSLFQIWMSDWAAAKCVTMINSNLLSSSCSVKTKAIFMLQQPLLIIFIKKKTIITIN